MSAGDVIPEPPPEGERPRPRSLRCVVCHFETEPDDVVAWRRDGVVCLHCVHRGTPSEVHLSRALLRDVREALG